MENSVNYGYCPLDETPLKEDVLFNLQFGQVMTFEGRRRLLVFALVRCPKCKGSYHADNPFLRQKASDYAKRIAAAYRPRRTFPV